MEENQKKNNKNKIIIGVIIVIIIIAAIVGIVFAINNNPNSTEGTENNPQHSNVQITSTDDMENLINTVYEGQDSILPTSLMTQVVDINNVDVLKSYTGLTSNENIDAVVASEPLMSSQAYSFVLVKVKDGTDANEIAKEMSENVDTRKWICVEAEKLYATSVNNLAVLVMASDEWATPVYNKLIDVLGTHGEEYVRENTDGLIDEQEIMDDSGIVVE